jgi:sugar phosphate isomerase/epimerase
VDYHRGRSGPLLDGIQVAPKEHGLVELSKIEQKEFADKIKSCGLDISGTSAGPNLVDPKLAMNLGPGIVTGEVKAVPEGISEEDAWKTCIASVKEACNDAEEIGTRCADARRDSSSWTSTPPTTPPAATNN